MKTIAISLILSLCLLALNLKAADVTVIQLATIAPDGTSLHKTLQLMGEKWRKASGGAVTLRIFAGGVAGGEAKVVSKMRVGQLQAAMLSVEGLAKIDPAITALEDIPMFFRSLDEVAYVRDKMRATIEKRFREKGFVLLFWGDAGWVRFFSKDPALRPADIKKMKMWVWAGNAEQEELMKSAGLQPVALETADIYLQLKTGLINALPYIPLGALASQFYGPCPHMLELNWGPLIGATIVKADVWDALPAATRTELLKAAAEAGEEVTRKARAESDEAVRTMRARGLVVHPVTPELEAEWRQFSESFYPRIRGKLVPADMFDEVQRVVKEFRASAGAPK